MSLTQVRASLVGFKDVMYLSETLRHSGNFQYIYFKSIFKSY